MSNDRTLVGTLLSSKSGRYQLHIRGSQGLVFTASDDATALKHANQRLVEGGYSLTRLTQWEQEKPGRWSISTLVPDPAPYPSKGN